MEKSIRKWKSNVIFLETETEKKGLYSGIKLYGLFFIYSIQRQTEAKFIFAGRPNVKFTVRKRYYHRHLLQSCNISIQDMLRSREIYEDTAVKQFILDICL